MKRAELAMSVHKGFWSVYEVHMKGAIVSMKGSEVSMSGQECR